MALQTPSVETHNEIEAIVGGYHGDAFRILGPHALPDGKDGGSRWVVRAFLPHASTVEVLLDGGAVPMEKKHAHGFFEARFDREPLRLPVRLHLWNGAIEILDDPYRFPPLLTISIYTCTGRAPLRELQHLGRAHRRVARRAGRAFRGVGAERRGGHASSASSTTGTRAGTRCGCATAASGKSSFPTSARARPTSTTYDRGISGTVN